jgi:UDP-apiose/xylose synthase
MRILLLGGGGFIGSHIVEHMLANSHAEILPFDRDLSKLDDIRNGAQAQMYKARVFEAEGDLSADFARVKGFIDWSDVVVDLIAYANPSMYVQKPLEVVKLNFFENLDVARACAELGKHLIQFSSCEVYGVSQGRTDPFSEDRTPLVMGPIVEHRWIYASAKQLLERILHAYGLEDRLSYTIIRPFNFIGARLDYLPKPGERGGPRVFPHFMAALLNDGPMQLVNGGHARRSYTYISDAVSAFDLVLRHIETSCANQIVNIGTPGNETSIRDLALLMKDLWFTLTGRTSKCPLVDISGEDFYGKGYADCDRRIPDVSKLMALGWVPKYDLESTVRESMRAYLPK